MGSVPRGTLRLITNEDGESSRFPCLEARDCNPSACRQGVFARWARSYYDASWPDEVGPEPKQVADVTSTSSDDRIELSRPTPHHIFEPSTNDRCSVERKLTDNG